MTTLRGGGAVDGGAVDAGGVAGDGGALEDGGTAGCRGAVVLAVGVTWGCGVTPEVPPVIPQPLAKPLTTITAPAIQASGK